MASKNIINVPKFVGKDEDLFLCSGYAGDAPDTPMLRHQPSVAGRRADAEATEYQGLLASVFLPTNIGACYPLGRYQVFRFNSPKVGWEGSCESGELFFTCAFLSPLQGPMGSLDESHK